MHTILKIYFFIFLLFTSLYAQDVNKKSSWGVEINPVSLTMLGTGSDTKIFSGVISHFNQNDATEMALSFIYAKDYEVFGSSYYEETSSKVANLALHYRKFINNRTKGFYYGGFGSYTYLDGELKNDIRLATVNKVGLGAEIGIRVMKTDSTWSLYWGPALRVGGYFGSNNDIFDDNDLAMEIYDRQFFIDVDFMRIGFRF